MALFNKKPKTASEIVALIKELPEEEFDKLSDMLLEDEDDNGKPDTMEQIEEAEENTEEKGEDSQTEKDRIDESVGEQEELDGDKDSQDADDRVDEAIGEEEAIEEKPEETEETNDDAEEKIKEDNKEEAMSAIVARMEALEERVAKIVESLDGEASFGNYSPDVTEGDGDESTEDSRIMQAYMRKQAYRR